MKHLKLEIFCVLVCLTFVGFAVWHCESKPSQPVPVKPGNRTGPMSNTKPPAPTGVDWTLITQILCAVIAIVPVIIPQIGQFIKDMGSKNYEAAAKDGQQLNETIKQLKEETANPASPKPS